ncbi:hypothetical protein BH23ACT12_BH23ACT12_01450 [soil metagenome]
MGLFPLAAALVSGVFSASLIRQFARHHGPHQFAWGTALATFAAASLLASNGMMFGWSPPLFRAYYLFGALVNVPILALGTVYLYLPRRVGHQIAVVVGLASAYAAFAVLSADLVEGPLRVSGSIPMGSQVMEPSVRALSRYYSYVGFLIVVAGAVWSALKLARKPGERFKRLAQGNWLIAAGTAVVALGSAFARQGQGSVFAVGLAVGVTIMYLGFLRTSNPAARRPGGVAESPGAVAVTNGSSKT